MLVSRLPGDPSRPPGFRSSSPSMLFMWIPVPGTITPDPQPVEAERDAAFPCASTTLMCVVDGSPAGSGANCRTRFRARSGGGGKVLLSKQAPRQAAAAEAAEEA